MPIDPVVSIVTINSYWPYVSNCRNIPQSFTHHPEGDVRTHLLQTAECAIKEDGDLDCVLAALLHDVGKSVESHGHEELAVQWLQGKVSPKTIWLIENHMRIHLFLNGEMKNKQKAYKLTNHPWFTDLVRLARWDKMGRRSGYIPKVNYIIEGIIQKMDEGGIR